MSLCNGSYGHYGVLSKSTLQWKKTVMGSENPIIGSNIIATATIYFMVL
jgi:hypothetical protein